MNKLSNIGVIRETLSRHGFRFSKALGQNFLVNPSVCPKMAEQAGIDGDMGVLEVGPGIGVLTHELCLRARKVAAVELDARLLPVLAETLSEFSNLTVINADIMKLDIRETISREFPGMRVAVAANLPYYITSPVIMRLLEERLPIESITVMVQKEAAARLCALPGTRESGAVSAAVRYYCEPEILFPVSRGSFLPAPEVVSAVIRLSVLEAPPVSPVDERLMFRVIKAAFSQRRKTAQNAISSSLPADKSAVGRALAQCSLPPSARAEALTLENFCALSDALAECGAL